MTGIALLTFAVAGIITFGWRFSFLALPDADERLAPWIRESLRHVPAAVLAALVAPAFLRHTGSVDLWDERLLAALVGGFVAWRTRSILATVVMGMAVLLAAGLV
ncbi:MAG: AzlD domain-containing protein [Actinomycetota bacterium]